MDSIITVENVSMRFRMDKNKTTLLEYPYGNKSESYTIPESVTHIPPCAFFYLKTLDYYTQKC